MAEVKDLIRQYLGQVNIMQLATAADNSPWVCTVHFYADDNFNLYWASTPQRRHSQEISSNPKAAAAILVHENTPEENYVMGISVTGEAELINGLPPQEVTDNYIAKHKRDPKLAEDITSGKNPSRFYVLKPNQIVLFDNKNFPDDPRKEMTLL